MKHINVTQTNLDELVEAITTPLLDRIGLLEENYSKHDNDPVFTRKETAALLKVDLSTLNRWTTQNKIKAHAIGARVYYKLSSIEDALEVVSPKNKTLW